MPAYPGLGLKLRYHAQNDSANDDKLYPMGIHPNCFGSNSDMILIREVAMMIVMDRLTDKPDWHVKVFDDAITEKWIEEALALPIDPMYNEIVMDKGRRHPKRLKTILNRQCLDYCIQEMRAKAKFFEKTGLIPTLDANASVAKSDSLVEESLHNALQHAFSKLQDEQKEDPDWHPGTANQVQDLVHPSLYPLVYGRTRVFADEVVGVEDAVEKWAGKGDVIPQTESDPDYQSSRRRWDLDTGIGGGSVEPSFWSAKYQWLPSNVKFQDDGSVKFTSYINNLHPIKHRDIYHTIEKLIEKALPAWDLCMPQLRSYRIAGAGRTKPRFPQPERPDDEVEENWTPRISEVQVPEPDKNPDDEAEVSGDDSGDENEEEEDHFEEDDPEDGSYYSGTRQEIAWQKIREPVQPQPPPFEAWDYGVKPGDSLRDQFKNLQIIVKMASIELTPENPQYPGGGWHVEGQMNEHIVGTALYYLDSENVTTSQLAFRTHTSSYQDDWHVGQNSFEWMERVYGTLLGSGSGGPCLQNYGSVETKQGRLLAFPNVFHHRVSPFELEDKTKPGHRRFIALWLVDPLTPIISTANVPPQQQSWWMERAFGGLDESNAQKVPQAVAELIASKAPGHPGLDAAVKGRKALPEELLQMVRDEFGDSVPMSLEEAKEHRLKLMDVRTNFQDNARSKWNGVTYSFCEH